MNTARRVPLGSRVALAGLLLLALLPCLVRPAIAGPLFDVTNLVTDDQAVNPAQITDPNLKNAWGISFAPTSPFWVSDNGTGLSTLYTVNPTTNATTITPLVVTIPPSNTGTPTGQVFNANSNAFNGDRFLFVSEDGTVSGWRSALGTTAEILQLGDTANVYKGTTEATINVNGNSYSYLYAANFRAGTIDVLKGTPGAPNLTGTFTDPNIPPGYAPFNIQKLGDKLYVTYALQDANKHDDVSGPGHGFVSAFNTQGEFLGRVGAGGTLNSPWGLALAPPSFGAFAGDLLVGNFGDGWINAFDPSTDTFVGLLQGRNGDLTIDGLWGLTVGNDGSGGSSNKLYFSAGPNGESDGLFGVITLVPEPSTWLLLGSGLAGLAGFGWRRKRQ